MVVEVPLFVEGASMSFTETASIASEIDSWYGGIPPTLVLSFKLWRIQLYYQDLLLRGLLMFLVFDDASCPEVVVIVIKGSVPNRMIPSQLQGCRRSGTNAILQPRRHCGPAAEHLLQRDTKEDIELREREMSRPEEDDDDV